MALDLPTYFNIILKMVVTLFRIIFDSFGKIANYCRRPKLKLTVSTSMIEFCDSAGKKIVPSFLSITLENRKSNVLHLDLDRVYLNGETLRVLMQKNPYFSKINKNIKSELRLSTNNHLLNIFRENWAGEKLIQIPAHSKLEIPIHPETSNDTMYFKVLKDAKLFNSKEKFVLRLKLNSDDYDYGVDRLDVVKRLVNILLHRRAR